MNPAFPDLLYNGIVLCISAQLIIIGFFKLFVVRTRFVFLGVFCIILGSLNLYNLYWESFKDNIVWSILLGGYKNIYFSPLLYVYFALLRRDVNKKKIIASHLALPTIVFVFYIGVKHISKSFFFENYHSIIGVIEIVRLLLLLFYLVWGNILFRNMKQNLKRKMYRKYYKFYNGFLVYLLILAIYSVVVRLGFDDHIDKEIYLNMQRYLFSPVGLLMQVWVLLFTITESKTFKSFFTKENTFINKDLIEGREIIKQRMETHFMKNKVFANPDIRLNDIAKKIGVSGQVLSEYIKNEYNMSFIDFVNGLRIDEFKVLLKNPDNRNYSLYGLAQEAGFKSKATFYRVFKNKERITPNEYLEKTRKY